jgi:hypothetical protein
MYCEGEARAVERGNKKLKSWESTCELDFGCHHFFEYEVNTRLPVSDRIDGTRAEIEAKRTGPIREPMVLTGARVAQTRLM